MDTFDYLSKTLKNKTMKTMSKISAFVMAIAILFSTTANAGGVKEKAVEKARSAVKAASPDDWKTLAKSAESLIRKNTNLGEAKEWLEKSIAINATAYNLEVMGDYYVKNNLSRNAIEYYVKSINQAKTWDANADTSGLQDKIMTAKKNM